MTDRGPTWSYPNLYIDKASGQELCDLLVVFGHHVIIFSDKSCEFPDTGDVKLDWSEDVVHGQRRARARVASWASSATKRRG